MPPAEMQGCTQCRGTLSGMRRCAMTWPRGSVFFEKLRRAGLIIWRAWARANGGAFFVRKKNDLLRMVLDCRQASQKHQQPHHSSLATAGGLSSLLLLSGEWDDARSECTGAQTAKDLKIRLVGRFLPVPGGRSVSESPTAGLEAMSPSTGNASAGRASRSSRWAGAGSSCFATRPCLSASQRALRSISEWSSLFTDRTPPPPVTRRWPPLLLTLTCGDALGLTQYLAQATRGALTAELESVGLGVHEKTCLSSTLTFASRRPSALALCVSQAYLAVVVRPQQSASRSAQLSRPHATSSWARRESLWGQGCCYARAVGGIPL